MSSVPQDNTINNLKDISNKNTENLPIKSLKDKFKIIKEHHPLEFYALGKINKNAYKNSSTFYNSSSLSSPRFRVKNSTNNLFDRNLLSINNSYFDRLKQVKNTATVKQLNKKESCYLEPLLIYKGIKEESKEYQKKNNINSLEWLNVIKNKLFSIDINSKIKNGTNISRNQFYEQKNKITLSPRETKDNSLEKNNKNNTSAQLENKNNLSLGIDYDYNNSIGSIDNILTCKRFKKDNQSLNKLQKKYTKQEKYSDYWKKLRIEKSKSTDELINKDFKKYDEKKLKDKFLFFDKNYTDILRHKNWWKINK